MVQRIPAPVYTRHTPPSSLRPLQKAVAQSAPRCACISPTSRERSAGYLFEDSGSDGECKHCIWSGLRLGFTLALTTSLALHLVSVNIAFPAEPGSTQSSRLSCQAEAGLITARSNLGTPRETPHGYRPPPLPSRSLLTYLSGSPRCAARARICEGDLPRPKPGTHTHLGPGYPAGGIRHLKPWRLHLKEYALGKGVGGWGDPRDPAMGAGQTQRQQTSTCSARRSLLFFQSQHTPLGTGTLGVIEC